MAEDNNQELSHKQFIILGLVAEQPSHAYNINQRINDRGMRDWTNIGKSSIYRIIGEIEELGLIRKSYEEEVDNRVRKIYTITNFGMTVLKKKVYDVIGEFFGRKDEDFYVAFSMLPILTYEEQTKAFTKSLMKIKKHKRELEKMLAENSHMPLNVTGLFIHPIKILKTDIEFLEWVLEEIEKGGGKNEFKALG